MLFILIPLVKFKKGSPNYSSQPFFRRNSKFFTPKNGHCSREIYLQLEMSALRSLSPSYFDQVSCFQTGFTQMSFSLIPRRKCFKGTDTQRQESYRPTQECWRNQEHCHCEEFVLLQRSHYDGFWGNNNNNQELEQWRPRRKRQRLEKNEIMFTIEFRNTIFQICSIQCFYWSQTCSASS